MPGCRETAAPTILKKYEGLQLHLQSQKMVSYSFTLMILAGCMESGYVETVVPVNEKSALENALVIGDPPNLPLPLLCSKASPPVHLPVELYSPFLSLFPAITHLLHAAVGFVIDPQLSLIK
jgi:hypothetical protein